MTDHFKALVVRRDGDGQQVGVETWDEDALGEGNVSIQIEYSTLNYKDGLALTGKAPVLRTFPIIPGIDFAGTVRQSQHLGFAPGDRVVLNGWGVGERYHGGLAERARIDGDWLIKLPPEIDSRRAMAIGTAGYTAMLCVLALEEHGVTAGAGPVLVTGAAGGVGGVAIALLSRLGYQVTASTGRADEAGYLRVLGATEVVARSEFETPVKPLSKERWAGAVDTVGSTTLANVLSQMRYRGTVAACGLAGGMDLPASVAPFILRGVTLAGVDSVMAPRERRQLAWQRLAADLDLDRLESMTRVIGLDEVVGAAAQILAGRIRGRLVVRIGN